MLGWAPATVAHGRALLAADPADAERHFTDALTHHERSPRRVHAARTHLAFGERLRRAHRRVQARTHLRAALAVFDDLGAARWAERARTQLRASGETARRRDSADTSALTPQELQVATLVAQGMPNRDAAAQLFVSPRTIEFHLREHLHQARHHLTRRARPAPDSRPSRATTASAGMLSVTAAPT